MIASSPGRSSSRQRWPIPAAALSTARICSRPRCAPAPFLAAKARAGLAEGGQPLGGAVAEESFLGVAGDRLPHWRRHRKVGVGGGQRDHILRQGGPAQVEGLAPQGRHGHLVVGKGVAHGLSTAAVFGIISGAVGNPASGATVSSATLSGSRNWRRSARPSCSSGVSSGRREAL